MANDYEQMAMALSMKLAGRSSAACHATGAPQS